MEQMYNSIYIAIAMGIDGRMHDIGVPWCK